jgi:hypothetical protein
MSSTNDSNGSGKAAALDNAPVSSSGQASDMNGHHTRPAGEVPVLDETLEEGDIKITIALQLHGRSTELVDVTLDRVVFEGSEGKNRWILLQGIQNTINEVRRATAYKLKKKLGLEEDSASGTSDCPEELRIHEPPPVNGSSW